MGAALDLATAALPGDELHAMLRALREEREVGHVRFGGRPVPIVLGHRALEAAFRDETAFPAGEWYRRAIEPTQGRTFESMDGPEHHLYRRLTTPAFRSRSVDRMVESGLLPIAHELLEGLAGESEVDLVAAYTRRYPFLVIARLLGIPRDRESAFVDWAQGILSFDRDAAKSFTEYLLPVLAARRREPRDDVLSQLVSIEVDGRGLRDEEVLSHVRLLFSAGATTTHDALGNLVYALLRDPAQLERARDDPARVPGAVDELLRWETPVAILPRLCVPGATLAGVEIPPESLVLFAITSANRDPGIFDEPDRFDPDRDSRAKLSFGLGTHSCPGIQLAKRNLCVAARALLEHAPGLRLLDEAAARPRGSTLRGPRVLPVALHSGIEA